MADIQVFVWVKERCMFGYDIQIISKDFIKDLHELEFAILECRVANLPADMFELESFLCRNK